MACTDDFGAYNMPLTLEQHFEELRKIYDPVKELHSLWVMLKKHIEDAMIYSRNVFVNFSLHDASHSRSIIQAIERFLGEDRIRQLSATDTFMILVCAYAHDYGMAQTYNKIYHILGSDKFKDFLEETEKNSGGTEKENLKAVKNLLNHLNEKKSECSLQDMYLSIMMAVEMYLRPFHWKGVLSIEEDFQGLFQGYVKNRFIKGSEGIVEICMCHGQPMDELLKLSNRADGMVADEFHPRFIAAMLRLGDLLDLDNSRFPVWFAREMETHENIIPRLSGIHYKKHEAVSHLLVTPKKIEIKADCGDGPDRYDIADMLSEWTGWLTEECKHLVTNWNEIAQPDFGRPPSDVKIDIIVDGGPYSLVSGKMQMSQDRVMKLLQGTNIYGDRHVGIREIIQNAVDASLLQLWYDITHNRYLSFGLSKNTTKSGLEFIDLLEEERYNIFGNYDITVEVIHDKKEKQVYFVVKDKGIGIAQEDVKHIADIGASKEKNERFRELLENIPGWMKPSGAFGIGLQSVFQMTNRVEFYTRQYNQPEWLISLESKGKITTRPVPPNEDGLYYDNSVPGTNAKIAIDIAKLRKDGSPFIYYDQEFDEGGELDMLFAEMGHVCEAKLKEFRYDYFNIYYQSIVINENGTDDKSAKRCLRKSFFSPAKLSESKRETMPFGELYPSSLLTEKSPYNFIENAAFYWDKESNRCYHLTIRPCTIVERDGVKQVYLPEAVQNLYRIRYKFNTIADVDTLYQPSNRSGRLHAGFLDWDILILDGDAAKYLNIDRDSLREDAIHEEELLTVCRDIMEKWCEYFCLIQKGKEKEGKKEKGKKEGEKSIEKNNFRNHPETLLSLVMLFYQNVPLERFREFIKPYQDFLKESGYVFGKDGIPVTYFWDGERMFRANLDLPMKFMATQAETEEQAVTEIELDMVKHLPHRLIHIEKILSNRNLKLMYYFRLFKPGNEINAIHMSEAARLYDYMKAFDAHGKRKLYVDYASIQKKVFKPNESFPHLLLPRYPHTFRKGSNLTASLDYCIHWYILSPFNNDTANVLRIGMEKGTDVGKELVEAVMKSRQMEKCVGYILKLRYADGTESENMKAIVRQEYQAFLEDFWELLYKNRSMVKEQFLVKGAVGQTVVR